MALRMLLVPARVPAARIHRMQGELPEIEQAARRATDELRSIAGDPPALDLVLAGVGEDGHVASIFGGRSAPSSGAKTDPVVAVHDSPRPPPRRLTLTLDVLSGAGLVIVAAFGASKAAAMRDALERSGATTPVAELLRRAISPVVLLDREAAGLLRDTYSLS
jgi:6-phosphogluconolactonase